jgi:hypothetical protein
MSNARQTDANRKGEETVPLPRAGHGQPHVVGGWLDPSGGPHRFRDPPPG